MIRPQSIAILCMASILSCTRPSGLPLSGIEGYAPEDNYFRASLHTLHFIIETDPVPLVDSTFQKYRAHYNLPVRAEGCADGEYTGESPFDAFGYRHVIRLGIENENIVSVDYDEIHFNGTGKQGDTLYCKEMSITGTTPAIAYPRMEAQLLENQDILQVEAVTGASYSLHRFRFAATVALIKARLKKWTLDANQS